MIFPLLQRLIKPAADMLSDIATRFHLHNGVFFPYTVKTLNICGIKFSRFDETDILSHSNFGVHEIPWLQTVKKV